MPVEPTAETEGQLELWDDFSDEWQGWPLSAFGQGRNSIDPVLIEHIDANLRLREKFGWQGGLEGNTLHMQSGGRPECAES